jgi:hypothetical protein
MKQDKQYFDSHKAVERLYFTSDQLAFFDEENAIRHAEHLEDKSVTTKTREEVEAETDKIANDNWEDLLWDNE